jgi:HAD superfamily hydrolase (TIGR01450 family)
MVSSLVDPHLSLRLDEADAILCDLDGCLISGDHVYADAREFIEEFRSQLWIVSNNSSDTATSLASRLKRHGVDLPAKQIVLAGEETVRRLAADSPGARVAIHATPAIRALATELGLDVAEEDVEAVVLGRDPSLGLGGLGRVIGHLQAGARLHVTNLDLTHPGANGTPVPETGALLAALCACLPTLRFQSIGKPVQALLDTALERAGVAPHSTVFIGDNLVTDGAAAALAGVHFIHLVRPVSVPSDGAHARLRPAPELAGTPC